MKDELKLRIKGTLRRNRDAIERAESTRRWIDITIARSSLVTDHALAELRRRCR